MQDVDFRSQGGLPDPAGNGIRRPLQNAMVTVRTSKQLMPRQNRAQALQNCALPPFSDRHQPCNNGGRSAPNFKRMQLVSTMFRSAKRCSSLALADRWNHQQSQSATTPNRVVRPLTTSLHPALMLTITSQFQVDHAGIRVCFLGQI